MKRTFNRKHLIWIIPVAAVAALTVVFLIYAGSYYHAEESVSEALATGGGVEVSQTDYGWYFDGPSEDSALVFYPGAKVEETAYAPLLHRLAAEGMDACLVKMPLRFAFFGKNKAGKVMEQYDYDRWFVGGHSLGGAMSAYFAADHG
ncbi:MAG: carboxymethylenebutenolidase, partial [Firmicutes bacterium]|nr:carboxymethylenebutenolidase [Bacillota bacterium]